MEILSGTGCPAGAAGSVLTLRIMGANVRLDLKNKTWMCTKLNAAGVPTC
jgi:hypothetical protein